MTRASIVALLAAFVVATAYELLVAVEVVELGSWPGEGAPGAGIFGWLAALGLLGGALLCTALATTRNAPALAALLAPAAGAFLLAFFHTFDPYYLPSLVRYSKRDFVPPELVYALVAAAVAAGVLTFLRGRVGLVLSVPAILCCGLVAFWSGIGH
jgi:hypothetical protein